MTAVAPAHPINHPSALHATTLHQRLLRLLGEISPKVPESSALCMSRGGASVGTYESQASPRSLFRGALSDEDFSLTFAILGSPLPPRARRVGRRLGRSRPLVPGEGRAIGNEANDRSAGVVDSGSGCRLSPEPPRRARVIPTGSLHRAVWTLRPSHFTWFAFSESPSRFGV